MRGVHRGIAELHEPRRRDRDSSGILQVRVATAATAGINPRDVAAAAEAFLTKGYWKYGSAIRIAKEHPEFSPGQVAQYTQGSGFPARYEQHRSEADAIVAAYGSGGSETIPSATARQTYVSAYRFERNADYDPSTGQKPESTWDCGRRIADERGWRWFESGSTIYYVSDEELMRSRPRMTITPETAGLMTMPTHRRDVGIPTQSIELDVRAVTWAAPPGSVVLLDEFGAAKDGRWLVQEVRRDDVTKTATHLTLTRAQAMKLEPAPQTKTRPAATGTGDTAPTATNAGLGHGAAHGSFRVLDTANRPGVPLTKDLTDFLGRMASFYDGVLVISTGTNHSQYTQDNNLSDHWTGNAADLGMVANHGTNDGPVGDKIAIAAFRAAGKSYAEAVRLVGPGGLNNVISGRLRVQVIWKNYPAHDDHVHVGVKRV